MAQGCFTGLPLHDLSLLWKSSTPVCLAVRSLPLLSVCCSMQRPDKGIESRDSSHLRDRYLEDKINDPDTHPHLRKLELIACRSENQKWKLFVAETWENRCCNGGSF